MITKKLRNELEVVDENGRSRSISQVGALKSGDTIPCYFFAGNKGLVVGFGTHTRDVISLYQTRRVNIPTIFLEGVSLNDPGCYRVLYIEKRVLQIRNGFLRYDGYYSNVRFRGVWNDECLHPMVNRDKIGAGRVK